MPRERPHVGSGPSRCSAPRPRRRSAGCPPDHLRAPASTILIIDDDTAILEMVSDLLTENGHTVVTAPSGEAGLALAKTAQPTLVLLDFCMPGMDGLEVIRALKAEPLTRSIPVVAFTGSTDADRMIAAGCIAHIPKPFTGEGLCERLDTLLRNTAGGPDRRSEL